MIETACHDFRGRALEPTLLVLTVSCDFIRKFTIFHHPGIYVDAQRIFLADFVTYFPLCRSEVHNLKNA